MPAEVFLAEICLVYPMKGILLQFSVSMQLYDVIHLILDTNKSLTKSLQYSEATYNSNNATGTSNYINTYDDEG